VVSLRKTLQPVVGTVVQACHVLCRGSWTSGPLTKITWTLRPLTICCSTWRWNFYKWETKSKVLCYPNIILFCNDNNVCNGNNSWSKTARNTCVFYCKEPGHFAYPKCITGGFPVDRHRNVVSRFDRTRLRDQNSYNFACYILV